VSFWGGPDYFVVRVAEGDGKRGPYTRLLAAVFFTNFKKLLAPFRFHC
jgi:hypothetical protein